MAKVSRGLGKGLEALFPQTFSEETNSQAHDLQLIEIEKIQPNPLQPRKYISEDALQELAQSIKDQGLLQPLLVRPSLKEDGLYELVAGERRWRASKEIGLTHVPVIVSKLDDIQTLIISLIENLQREDLNAIEEAEALSRLYNELQISQDDISNKIGKSRSSIANSLRLLQLEPFLQEAVRQGDISPGQARTLLAITDQQVRQTVFELITLKGLTVRQLEKLVSYWKEYGTLPPDLEKPFSAKKGSKKKKDRDFLSYKKRLQETISSQFRVKVHIQGEKDQGSISLKYFSEEELNQLLDRLGIDRSKA